MLAKTTVSKYQCISEVFQNTQIIVCTVVITAIDYCMWPFVYLMQSDIIVMNLTNDQMEDLATYSRHNVM